ncbi:MAG: 4Fe-4S dicluster domain-containing protein [Candidatus Cloacimonetes bacterium]|nr:4Fe-4S dicluster domain-containing protein [Candidatus Cloacimonadota bacterium]MCF7813628.1 4Fe-4S dicluster domain-containing protein [Candidatus Cloacimonadota bacterium]MCF7868307.1 4Fe-4S dicluster domain-containing protein [Candidatus Cloacimonadota bacterium]MCF7883782.1 4Fe-4S dicluster domain-containing protein [Candidatus Cloacimonadota bacterium]
MNKISDEQIYRRLQQHLDNFPIGMPATDSGVEIRILKFLFTPIEARIACCLNLAPKRPVKVFRRFQDIFQIELTEKEITDHLHEMFMKGCLERSGKEGSWRYSNAMLAIGMFEYHVDKLTPEFMKDMNEYFDEAFAEEFHRTAIPQLRTSPHWKALAPEYKIATYDDMRSFVQNVDKPIQVANCICKQGEELLGNHCKRTDNIEICLIFGSKSYAARKQVREISKKECLAILDRAEREGMVLQPGNTREPFCICICCGCCCGVLTAAKQFPNPAELFATNYYAEITKENCIGCSICVGRCQMEAIKIENVKAEIDLGRCIGCGLCVTTCPPKAIKLKQKAEETVPPKNTASLYMKILQKKFGKRRTMMKMLKLLLG